MAAMPSAVPPTEAPAMPPACSHCLALAAEPRRREPHERLALRGTAPVAGQSEAGVAFSMLCFTCRECGTVWRLYDRPGELFVSWVPEGELRRE